MATHGNDTGTEPFPTMDTADGQGTAPSSPRSPTSDVPPSRRSTSSRNRPAASSSISGRLRRVSRSFEQSELPEGFLAATGTIASSIFTRQAAPRPAVPTIGSASAQQPAAADGAAKTAAVPSVPEEPVLDTAGSEDVNGIQSSSSASQPPAAAPFSNGYHFPPRHSFGQSTKLGARAFWNYSLTPVGFCVTIYGLNVVAWGGMLFLLLCNACKMA